MTHKNFKFHNIVPKKEMKQVSNITVILFAMLLAFSCSKYEDLSVLEVEKDPIALAKEQFRKDSIAFLRSGEKPNYNFRQSLKREIDWGKAKVLESHVSVPINTLLPEGMVNENGSNTINGRAWILIDKDSITDSFSFQLVTLLPDSNSTLGAFSGTVFMEDYFLGDVRHTTYENGQITDKRVSRSTDGNVNKLRAASYNCEWVTVASVCVGYMPGGSTDPMCDDRYELRCGWTNVGMPIDFMRDMEDELNNGGWGGTGGNNGNSKLTKQPSKDPCEGREAVNERMKMADMRAKNLDILSKIDGYEHGFESVLDVNTMRLFNNPVRTDGKTNMIRLNSHLSNDHSKMTVGYTHSHPGLDVGPNDLFMGVNFYNNIPAAHQKIFTDYYTSTIVNSENTYVVTIKNVSKWLEYGRRGEADNYASFNTRVHEMEGEMWGGGTFYSPSSRTATILEMFGDAINIYMKDSKGNFVPVSLKDGKLVNPCDGK